MDQKQNFEPLNQNPSQTDDGKALMSWRAPEYEQQEKSRGWFIGAGIIAALLIGASIWMRNYLLIIIVVLFAIVIYTLHKKEPLVLKIKLTEKGIRFGKKFYPYKNIENFWIIYDPPAKTLNLKTTSTLFPQVSLQIQDQDPLRIRDLLLDYIEEDGEKTEETNGERLARRLKI